ncbi:MAG: hypothetical protein IIT53_15740 [Fibrobacter sp.]|jgi:hypothetical protein|nr:hypothetical protein [Fibrobacter sp.]
MKKREYCAPEIKVVQLEHCFALLQPSEKEIKTEVGMVLSDELSDG